MWATANTRAALWNAVPCKQVYTTTGMYVLPDRRAKEPDASSLYLYWCSIIVDRDCTIIAEVQGDILRG